MCGFTRRRPRAQRRRGNGEFVLASGQSSPLLGQGEGSFYDVAALVGDATSSQVDADQSLWSRPGRLSPAGFLCAT